MRKKLQSRPHTKADPAIDFTDAKVVNIFDTQKLYTLYIIIRKADLTDSQPYITNFINSKPIMKIISLP